MQFLYKKFIRDYKNTKDDKVRSRYGIFAGTVGIICNIILAILKFLIGFLFNSISLIGDAINNLGDSLSSFINIFSFKINNKPADKEHPYGHRRSEYIGAFFISIMIIVVAIELFFSSIDKILNPSETIVSGYLIMILIASVALKSFMAIIYKNTSKTINSISLNASYKDSLNDILMTIIIIFGLYISKYFNYDIDGYLGIGLTIFIIISSIKLIKESINKLLGVPLEESKVNYIVEDILENDKILGIHDVLTHQYGEGSVFMSLHVEMDASLCLLTAHEIIDKIERDIKEKYYIELLIHIDPIDYKNKELVYIKKIIISTLNEIDMSLSCHDIRIDNGDRVYFDLVMPYSYQNKSKQILDIVVLEITRKSKYKPSIDINYI